MARGKNKRRSQTPRSGRPSKEGQHLNDEHFQKIDKQYLAPDEMAAMIYSQVQDRIQHYTHWELLCFAAELAGSLALGMDDKKILNPMKVALKRIYSIHYNHAEEIYPSPTRPSEELAHELDTVKKSVEQISKEVFAEMKNREEEQEPEEET